ncbi:AsmA family protein [Pseudoalteromonas sp. C2R02]|uniref:AsmA family protein n=1 Tax=Pseudoalteromonas sp. C2R02 TaxID=2841565 RepID=UPI001C09C59A|nr:AsmA family protein [Pseudoalteromonas sp. C2R02]MBU2967871.1 AsmA family protein [Pseudoalteromonas sp. C2R02]
MKILLKVLAVLVGLMVAIIIIVPLILPVDTVFAQVSDKVEQATNRKLSISGDKTLSLFPALKLEMNDVYFSNMDSGSQKNMISMKQLAINIPWLSLLSGELKLEKFVIMEPNILLEKNKAGRVNWDLFSQSDSETQKTKNDAQLPNQQNNIPSDFDIKLGEVAIYGGKLTYLDATTDVKHIVNDFKLTIELPSLHQPLNIKGAVTYMAQRIKLDTSISTPIKAISSENFILETKLSSSLFVLNFKGNIEDANSVIKGELELKGKSVKEIVKWQNIELNAGETAFNEFAFSGGVLFKDNKLSLSNLNAKLDELDIKGQSAIDLDKRLKVSAHIDLGMLNLNPYLPIESKQESKDKSEKKPEPIIWDETQIDLSALKTIDADIKVKSTGLQLRDITLGRNAFSFKLEKGEAEIVMDEFNAYKGKGKGKIFINAKKTPYTVATNFSLTDIQAGPLLRDVIKFDKLDGTGSINWQLNTKGVNQKQFIDSLNGGLGFGFENGAIQGANIAAMVRSAKAMLKGDFTNAGLDKGFDKSQQTDFAELSGTFKFKNGVGRNNDFKLFSPLIRITGKGELDLPKTNIDYKVTTGLVSSIEGQGTTSDATGFKVPVKIKGPLHDVKIKLDVSSASKDELKNKVKDKLKKLFG